MRERIAVCISSNPEAQYLIARGARMAEGVGGELHVVYVDIGRDATPERQKMLAENMRFAENLGAQIARLKGKKVAERVAEFVREKHITQVIFGRSARANWQKLLYLSVIHKFLQEAPTVDVHIITLEVR